MRRERRSHLVVADHPRLLEALAAPFGTYDATAVCRAVPGVRSLEQLAVDLLCAVGKTEALTRRGRVGLELVDLWFAAYQLRYLFVTGADALPAEVWRALCSLGDQVGFEVVFVSADPSRPPEDLSLPTWDGVCLRVDPEGAPVPPPVGAPLPEVGFPALPAACQRFLEPAHAARAQAIYDECLVAAFDALPYDHLLEQGHVDAAFRAALARTPDLSALALAIHAVRAAGILRGYDVRIHGDGLGGVGFDDLLTADRLDQLARLVSPEQAAAGVLAGLPGAPSWPTVNGDGAWVESGGTWQPVSSRLAAVLRAWQRSGGRQPHPRRAGPPRPVDRRWREAWRTPPPERLVAAFTLIDCRSLRFMADPPMDWARPRRTPDGGAPRFRPC